MTEPNVWRQALLNADDIAPGYKFCVFCGKPATDRHHIVPKGMGGRKSGDGPTVPVCGNGNASGCHKLLHQGKIHLRCLDGKSQWEYVRIKGKRGMKLTEVIMNEELLPWKPVRTIDFEVADLFGGFDG